MLLLKCLSDGQRASETSFPDTGPTSNYNFCNVLKPTIRSHILYTVIGQLCEGEKWARVGTSLFSCEEPSATLWMPSRRDCLKMCTVIPIFEWLSRLPPMTAGFQCGRTEQLEFFLVLIGHNPTLKGLTMNCSIPGSYSTLSSFPVISSLS